MLLNPLVDPAVKALPITIFESELKVVMGAAQLSFVEVVWKIETHEAERVAVEDTVGVRVEAGMVAERTSMLPA